MEVVIEYDPSDTDDKYKWFMWIEGKSMKHSFVNISFYAAKRLMSDFDFTVGPGRVGDGSGYRFTLKDSARDTRAMQRCNPVTVAE
jgi:hypothetical protein